jgi:protein-disulfide isomerase
MPRLARALLWLSFGLLLLTACGAPAPPPSAAPRDASDELPAAEVLTDDAPVRGAGEHADASVPVTAADPQWGSPLAPVTIVEFGDFECPFCSRVGPTLKRVKDTYGPEKVRIVWKHHPLPFHKNARGAHEAGAVVFALGGSDAFWRFHDLAFANQRELSDENFEQWAAESGVSGLRFREAIAAGRHIADVEADIAVAKLVGVSGTPGFRVNGVTISGAQPFEKFAAVIDEQLAAAAKLVAAGTPPAAIYTVLSNENQKRVEPAADAVRAPADDEDGGKPWAVPIYPDDPQRGAADPLVTIVMFSDLQCPFCKRVEETLDQLLAKYPDELRIVWKDNPLPFHPRAKPAAAVARAAYEAKGDAGFWIAQRALFDSAPKLEDQDLKAIAASVGLPWAKVQATLCDGCRQLPPAARSFARKIDQSVELASDFKARGTPHFFINGVRLSGAQPFEKFDEVVATQIAELKKSLPLIVLMGGRKDVYNLVMTLGQKPPGPEKKLVPAPDATSPYRGNANAKVVIQLWSEFQCPFCKRLSPTLQALEKLHGNKIKIVWRHLPLPFHKEAPLAAEAAQEVFAQKGNAAFWRYHDKLFDAQGTQDGLGRANLERLAAEVGVDMARFRAALDSGKHKAKVEADAKAANDAGINGTPGSVINGYYVSGAQAESAFTRLIDRAHSEATAKKPASP